MGIIVNSIGDGACISLFSRPLIYSCDFEYSMQGVKPCKYQNKPDFNCRICGSQTNKCDLKRQYAALKNVDNINLLIDYGKFTAKTSTQLQIANNFLLTHFHQDHYRGFLKKSNNRYYYDDHSTSIRNFYYQAIPEFHSRDIYKHANFLVTLANIFRLFFKNNRLVEFQTCFRGLRCRKIPVYCQRGCQGPKIANDQYEVIWPLDSFKKKNIDDKGRGSDDIEKYREDLEDEIETLYKSLKRFSVVEKFENIFENCIEYENDNRNKIDLYLTIEKAFKNIPVLIIRPNEYSDYSEIQKSELDRLSKIANHFSVCLYKEGELLTLGDLEDEDIPACLNHFFSNHGNPEQVEVKCLITAHHGTHYGDICQRVKADYVISSNGSARIDGFKKQYAYSLKNINQIPSNICGIDCSSISGLHNTYCKGDFVN